MVTRSVSWSCDKCGKAHCNYEKARDCEMDHVMERAIAETKAAIAAAFDRARTERTSNAG